MLILRCVKGMVVERNLKIQEAKDEIFGVLDEIQKSNMTDRYVHDTLLRITSQMQHRAEYQKRYLEVIDDLQTKNPTDKELVKSVYEGSLRNNKFEKAAKMAS